MKALAERDDMTIKDGDWTLDKYDYVTGRSRWYKFETDGSVTYRTDTPVQDTLDMNAFLRNSTAGNAMGDYVQTASIPMAHLFHEGKDLLRSFNESDDKYISRWLNDSDNRKFRTFEGRF